MVFTAGMICFGCDPNWADFVWRSGDGRVTAVNIDGDACVFVDEHCGPFGRAAAALVQRVMQSSLAKLPQTPLPALDMLVDREAMCDWLRKTLAVQPLANPASLSPYDDTAPLSRRLQSGAEATTTPTPMMEATAVPPTTLAPTAPPWATRPKHKFNPVDDGLKSGFGIKKELLQNEQPTPATPIAAPLPSSTRRSSIPTLIAAGLVILHGRHFY